MIRVEVRRGTRAYRATVHPTTRASPNKLMLGRELRGKLAKARRKTERPDDATVRKRDREQKEKMMKYADKRRYIAPMEWSTHLYASKKRRTASRPYSTQFRCSSMLSEET